MDFPARLTQTTQEAGEESCGKHHNPRTFVAREWWSRDRRQLVTPSTCEATPPAFNHRVSLWPVVPGRGPLARLGRAGAAGASVAGGVGRRRCQGVPWTGRRERRVPEIGDQGLEQGEGRGRG